MHPWQRSFQRRPGHTLNSITEMQRTKKYMHIVSIMGRNLSRFAKAWEKKTIGQSSPCLYTRGTLSYVVRR